MDRVLCYMYECENLCCTRLALLSGRYGVQVVLGEDLVGLGGETKVKFPAELLI